MEHTSWRARAGPHGRFYTRSEDHLVAFEPFHAVKDELQAARKRYRLQASLKHLAFPNKVPAVPARSRAPRKAVAGGNPKHAVPLQERKDSP